MRNNYYFPRYKIRLPPVQSYTEEELVLALKQQSRDGFNYLYANYSAVLFGVVKRIIPDEDTSADVLQEAFVRSFEAEGAMRLIYILCCNGVLCLDGAEMTPTTCKTHTCRCCATSTIRWWAWLWQVCSE